jgi:hypothetical protein
MTFAKSILFIFISFHLVFGFWNTGRRVDRLDTIAKIYPEKKIIEDSTKNYNSIQISALFANFNRIQGSLFVPQKSYMVAYNKSLEFMPGPEISIAWMPSRYYGYKLALDYASSRDEISGYFGDLYQPYPYNSVSNEIYLYSVGPGVVFCLPVSKKFTFNWELICQLLYWRHHVDIGYSLYELRSVASNFTGWTISAFPRMRCDYYLSHDWSLSFLTGFQISNVKKIEFNKQVLNINREEPLTNLFYSFGLTRNIYSKKR